MTETPPPSPKDPRLLRAAAAGFATLLVFGGATLAMRGWLFPSPESNVLDPSADASTPDASYAKASGSSSERLRLGASSLRAAFEAHTSVVQAECWDKPITTRSSVDLSIHVVVGPGGKVSSLYGSGNDKATTRCIENQVRSWMFDSEGEGDIPFRFSRDAGPPGATASLPSTLTAASLERAIQQYKGSASKACWENTAVTKKTADVNVSVVIGNGLVISAVGAGSDSDVTACLERHVQTWKIDGSGRAVIPFRFTRD